MSTEPSPYLITPSLAQAIDAWTIDKVGIPSFSLMELAGSKAASAFLEDFPMATKVLVLLGKGNNAGDGLVMARHLLLANPKLCLSLCLVFNEPPKSVDAYKNWQLLTDNGYSSTSNRVRSMSIDEILSEDVLSSYDVCIDALFGVGLSRNVEAPLCHLFKALKTVGTPVVSLDVPSGLDAGNGVVLGHSVQAHYTYTFGYDKVGFYLNEAFHHTGKVRVLPLGYDLDAFMEIEKPLTNAQLVVQRIDTQNPVAEGLKNPPKHKYDGGAVLILGSSEGLTGATISVAQTAWAAGTSAIFLILPKGLSTIFETALPYAIKWYVGDEDEVYLKNSHLNEVISKIANFGNKGSICIGPGLGIREATQDLVNQLMPEIKQPLVIDADALRALTKKTTFSIENSAIVLTPHIGEWEAIENNYGLAISSKKGQNLASLLSIRDFASNNKIHLVRKGNPTVLATPNGHLRFTTEVHLQALFNKTGFGDVLSGLIATALSRFSSTERAIIWSLQKGLQAAENAVLHQKKFYPESVIDFVKSEE